MRELPSIDTMATLVHVGPVSDVHRSYGMLASWVEQNQRQVAGSGWQIVMQLLLKGHDDQAVFSNSSVVI